MKATEKNKEKKYSKNAILQSKKFAQYQDIMQSQLKQNRFYTLQELENIVKKFKNC